MIDFAAIKTEAEDMRVIGVIVDRAQESGIERDRLDLLMDLQVVHNTCPLDLAGLVNAKNTDFLHDVYGIINNLNRETGQLENCFLPRFSRRQLIQQACQAEAARERAEDGYTAIEKPTPPPPAPKRSEGMKQSTMQGITFYINDHIDPGGFLCAVLSNDLCESFGRADQQNREDMFEIVSWLYTNAPIDCWGSPERVATWLRAG